MFYSLWHLLQTPFKNKPKPSLEIGNISFWLTKESFINTFCEDPTDPQERTASRRDPFFIQDLATQLQGGQTKK